MFNTPILFLIFNRPDTTALVFEQIKKVQPKFLFISADGPRHQVEGEEAQCKETLEIVLNNIDWNCEVKTLLQTKNIGCKNAVSQGINWFFDNVEQGIILEDDCLPNESFFMFCEQMLIKYKNDTKIFAINGCNFNYTYHETESYFFSRYMNVWGWATWKRSAKIINYEIPIWNHKSKLIFLWTRLRNRFIDFDLDWFRYWKNNFNAITSKTLDTWDYQWEFYQLLTKKITIVTSKNLIVNIGFHSKATHTTSEIHPAAMLHKETINFPLNHPTSKKTNEDYEERVIKPIWHMYSRKKNLFYLLNYINTMPLVQYIKGKLNFQKESTL